MDRLPSRRGFHKSERRVFCPCELCRLRFGRMLFSRDGGPPLRSYRRHPRPRTRYATWMTHPLGWRIDNPLTPTSLNDCGNKCATSSSRAAA